MTTATIGPALDREALARDVLDKAHGYARNQARGKGPQEMAEACRDAATDAIVRALGRADEVENLNAYAWRAVRRAVALAIRDWHDRERLPTVSMTDATTGEPIDVKARPVSAEVLSAELCELLPPALADAVRLVHLEGMATRQAAAVLGVTAGTVSRRLAVARARLTGERAVIQPRGRRPDPVEAE